MLPSQVPDTGSAGRGLVAAIAAGGVGGAPLVAKGAVLAAIYSRLGQRILTKPGRGFKGPVGQTGARAAGAVAPHAAAAEARRENQ